SFGQAGWRRLPPRIGISGLPVLRIHANMAAVSRPLPRIFRSDAMKIRYLASGAAIVALSISPLSPMPQPARADSGDVVAGLIVGAIIGGAVASEKAKKKSTKAKSKS